MSEILRPAVYAATPLTSVWATSLFSTRLDDSERLKYLFKRARGWDLVRKGIWSENHYLRRHKMSCVGQTISWAPQWVSGDEGSYDSNIPGTHAPRTDIPKGVGFNDLLLWLNQYGYTCGWCKQYQKSLIEAVAENIMKPSPLFQYLNKQPWRSHDRPHPYKKY